jgi:hypothetical protein
MGITNRAINVPDSQKLVDYLSSEQVAAAIAQTGLEPVIAEK